MKNLFKKRLKRFVDLTTMHGFSEIYYAQSMIGKCFWISLVIYAAVSSGYEIHNIIEGYVNMPTSTKMQTLKDKAPFYPPLRICYVHWLQWLDWSKALEEGFTKESLLYGASYLTDIYSGTTTFDVDIARSDWINRTESLNLTRLKDAYVYLAYDEPPNFRIRDSNVSFAKSFSTPKANVNRLCYELNFEKINQILNARKDSLVPQADRKLTIYYQGNYSYIFDTVSLREYDLYAKSFIQSILISSGQEIPLDDANLTGFATPPLVNFDGNLDFADSPTFDNAYIHYVRISGTVFAWLNTATHPCRSVRNHHLDYEHCPTYCMYEELRAANRSNATCLSYFEAVQNGNVSFEKVCNRSIVFDLSNVSVANDDYQFNLYAIELAQNCIRAKCLPACEEWIFSSTVSASPASVDLRPLGYKTEIEVEYPPNFAILVHTEVRTQTWDSFVADIGGVLGLWMGASILSFFQAVHILLCSYPDDEEGEVKNNSSL